MPEINERGNQVLRRFLPGCDRYTFDCQVRTPAKGRRRYDSDQDACYFGVLVHIHPRQILTCAEGDVIRVHCPDDTRLRAELDVMAARYGPPAAAATLIQPNGAVTHLYDPRPGLP